MSKPILKGVEAIFIPIKSPELAAKWYEEKLGFSLLYLEEGAAVMRIDAESQTVVCLVKAKNHIPLNFPDNYFGVGKFFNFITHDIEETYRSLIEKNVKVNELDGEGETKFFTFYDLDGNPLGVCQ